MVSRGPEEWWEGTGAPSYKPADTVSSAGDELSHLPVLLGALPLCSLSLSLSFSPFLRFSLLEKIPRVFNSSSFPER